jgi:hypothetical protein
MKLVWLFLPAAFMLASCLVYSSTLKMGAICSSETLVDFQLEDNTLHDDLVSFYNNQQ